MKIDKAFAIAAICACFVLFSIAYVITLPELMVDWDRISGIVIGIYLYLVYLILSIFGGKPEIQKRYSQRKESDGEKQKTYSNQVYEY